LLTPESIQEQLKFIISIPPYEHEKDAEGSYIDIAQQNAEVFTSKILQTPDDIMENLSILLTGEQRQVRILGRIFAENISNVTDYIENGLSILTTIEYPNPELIVAMMDILKKKDKNTWDIFIRQVIQDEKLVKFLPRFLQSSKPSVDELQLVIDQIKKHHLDITVLRHFGSGMSLHHLSLKDIEHLVSELLNLKEEGAWIALDILSMYTHSSKEKFIYLVEVVKQVILAIEFETTNNQVMDFYYLEQAIKQIDTLETDQKFITTLSGNIFLQAFSRDIESRGSIKKVVHYLIKKHGDIVWPILFQHIEKLTPIQEFRMEQMIGHSSNTDNNFALVNDIPDNKVIELCKQSKKAARTLAKSIKVITEVESEWKFTSIAMKMIDEFGSEEMVLSAISSNLYSFSWVGSAVPYYLRQKSAFTNLLSHTNKNIRDWAQNELAYLEKRIKSEQQSDEEHDFGIYDR